MQRHSSGSLFTTDTFIRYWFPPSFQIITPQYKLNSPEYNITPFHQTTLYIVRNYVL